MSDNYLSGKTGQVGVATASNVDWGTGVVGSQGPTIQMSFGEWRMPMEAATPEITNFTTTPYRAYIPGVVGATGETNMPGYNQGNTPLTCGNAYVLLLNWTNSIGLTGTAILKKLEPDDKADGVPTVKASWQFTGALTLAIT